ncbi:TPA: hypothetical protein I9082_002264 [Clostridium perfringens]|nr:hypothetical protein [Clostridium perfringens]
MKLVKLVLGSVIVTNKTEQDVLEGIDDKQPSTKGCILENFQILNVGTTKTSIQINDGNWIVCDPDMGIDLNNVCLVKSCKVKEVGSKIQWVGVSY